MPFRFFFFSKGDGIFRFFPDFFHASFFSSKCWTRPVLVVDSSRMERQVLLIISSSISSAVVCVEHMRRHLIRMQYRYIRHTDANIRQKQDFLCHILAFSLSLLLSFPSCLYFFPSFLPTRFTSFSLIPSLYRYQFFFLFPHFFLIFKIYETDAYSSYLGMCFIFFTEGRTLSLLFKWTNTEYFILLNTLF